MFRILLGNRSWKVTKKCNFRVCRLSHGEISFHGCFCKGFVQGNLSDDSEVQIFHALQNCWKIRFAHGISQQLQTWWVLPKYAHPFSHADWCQRPPEPTAAKYQTNPNSRPHVDMRRRYSPQFLTMILFDKFGGSNEAKSSSSISRPQPFPSEIDTINGLTVTNKETKPQAVSLFPPPLMGCSRATPPTHKLVQCKFFGFQTIFSKGQGVYGLKSHHNTTSQVVDANTNPLPAAASCPLPLLIKQWNCWPC